MIDEAPSIPSLGATTPKGAAMLKGDTKYIALSAIAVRPGRMRSGFVRLPPVVFGIEKINGLVAASASDRLATVIVRLTMKLGAPFENPRSEEVQLQRPSGVEYEFARCSVSNRTDAAAAKQHLCIDRQARELCQETVGLRCWVTDKKRAQPRKTC